MEFVLRIKTLRWILQLLKSRCSDWCWTPPWAQWFDFQGLLRGSETWKCINRLTWGPRTPHSGPLSELTFRELTLSELLHLGHTIWDSLDVSFQEPCEFPMILYTACKCPINTCSFLANWRAYTLSIVAYGRMFRTETTSNLQFSRHLLFRIKDDHGKLNHEDSARGCFSQLCRP